MIRLGTEDRSNIKKNFKSRETQQDKECLSEEVICLEEDRTAGADEEAVVASAEEAVVDSAEVDVEAAAASAEVVEEAAADSTEVVEVRVFAAFVIYIAVSIVRFRWTWRHE